MDSAHLGPELLGDYAEGLLDPAARNEADRHLRGCEACRRDLAAAQAYFRDMAALPVHRAPDRFLTRVHARIAKASPWRRLFAILSSPRLLPVPLAAVTVIGMGLLFSYLFRTDMARDSAPESTVTYAAPKKEAAPRKAEEPPASIAPQTEPVVAAPGSVASPQARTIGKAAAKPRSERPSGDVVALLEKEAVLANSREERDGHGAEKRKAGNRAGSARSGAAPAPRAEQALPDAAYAEEEDAAPPVPPGYAVELREGRSAENLRDSLQALGVRVLGNRSRDGEWWDLEVPAARIAALEGYLRGLGKVTPSPRPPPGSQGGAPVRLTVRLFRAQAESR